MSQLGHIDRDEMALYALELLDAAEAVQISEHVRECEACRDEIAAMRGDLVAFALTAEMQAPAASAKQRLMNQVAREKKVVPLAAPVKMHPSEFGGQTGASAAGASAAGASVVSASGVRAGSDSDGVVEIVPTRSSGAGSRILPWLGWAVAAGAAAVAFSFYSQREELRANLVAQGTQMAAVSAQAAQGKALIDALTDRSAMRVTLNPGVETPKPQGRATYVADKGTLVFLASNLAPLEAHKTYELWLIPAAAGAAPMPAGTFEPDARGNASVILPELPKGVVAKAFGVTIETEGGSKTPTPPIVLSGA